jgi:threonine efflux protein
VEYLPVLLGVFTAHVLLMVAPGPNMLTVSSISINQGRYFGFFASLGVACTAAIWASAALLGLSVLMRELGWFYTTLKWVGGSYLIYLGWRSWRNANSSIHARDIAVLQSGWQAWRMGFLTNITNPKSIGFFASIFTAIVPSGLPVWVRILIVAIVFLDALIWHCFITLALSTPTAQTALRRAKAWVDRVVGTVMIFFGARLILSRT